MVNHNKLFVRILTPSIQSVKEYLTIDFLTINNGTGLGSNIQAGITAFCQLNTEVRLTQEFDNLLGRTCGNQNLIQRVFVNRIQKILTITIGNHLLILNHIQLLDNNLRRKNITFFYQLRCRNVTDDFTVDFNIIHTWLENSDRMLRSSSEEVTPIRVSSKVLRSREKVTLN